MYYSLNKSSQSIFHANIQLINLSFQFKLINKLVHFLNFPTFKSIFIETEASHTPACPRMDLMTGNINLTADNIETSSNILEKANLIGGNIPWISNTNDSEPYIIVRLSGVENVAITDIRLVDPVNILAYNVTVIEHNGDSVFKLVG